MHVFKRMIIILFTVFLFNQKEVSSQTEEEQILSSSDDNIVKVLLSSLTPDTFLSNRKMCLSLKMNNDQFTYCLSVPQEIISSQTEEEQTLSSSDDNIVKVLLSSFTRDTFLSNRKMCLSLKE